MKGGNAADPGSWNKYAYVHGDPINFNDPQGLLECSVGGFWTCESFSALWDLWYPNHNPPGGYDSSWLLGVLTTAANQIAAQITVVQRQLALQNALGGATDRLFSKDCAGLFLTPDSADDADTRRYLSERLSRLGYAEDNSDPLIRIQNRTAPGGPNAAADTTDTFGIIRIWDPFFTGTNDKGQNILAPTAGGPFAGMTLAGFQQLTLIHEFMHWMDIVGPDSGEYSNQSYTLPNGDIVTGSAGISQEVKSKCFQ